jgi:transposase
MKKKLVNDPKLILETLRLYQANTEGVVVESTYNWYWLVDALMEEGYQAHLANPATIQKYSGLKHADDKTDVLWLAEMLRLGILREGYIYPKGERSLRDLPRTGRHVVRLRTSLTISLKNIITRSYGITLKSDQIKSLSKNYIHPVLPENEFLYLAVTASKASIDSLSKQITLIESTMERQLKAGSIYRNLTTIPGVEKYFWSLCNQDHSASICNC